MLLDVDHKIISKILAQRLHEKLGQWLGQDQRGFVKGRQIQEGTIWVQAVIESMREASLEGSLVFLDQGNAYDRVKWGYLRAVLERVGMSREMSKEMIRWMASVSASILVNGWQGEEFWNDGGVLQGDPLAPLLYVLIMEPVINKL